jgi:hypothetical protein
MSILRDNGIALTFELTFELPKEHRDRRYSYLDIRSATTGWWEISSQQVRRSDFLSSMDRHAGHGKWGGNALGLGLPAGALGVPFGRDEQVTDSAGSHLELSFDLDIDVHGHDSIAAPADIPLTAISGLQYSTVSGWPSPFLAWNAQSLACPPQLSAFGLAIPLSPSVATPSQDTSDIPYSTPTCVSMVTNMPFSTQL